MFPKRPLPPPRKFGFRPTKDPPPPAFNRGFLGEMLPSSYRARLRGSATSVADQIPVLPSTQEGGFYHVPPYGVGPFGHITASRNSPPLLFHEFSHALENLPSDMMSVGMFRDELGPAVWALLGPEEQARAQRLYSPASAWGPWEYYPTVGGMYNWNPAAMPSEIRPYYSPWFRSSPDPRDLSFGTRLKSGYPTRWTGGP